jgi:hypothetical protein
LLPMYKISGFLQDVVQGTRIKWQIWERDIDIFPVCFNYSEHVLVISPTDLIFEWFHIGLNCVATVWECVSKEVITTWRKAVWVVMVLWCAYGRFLLSSRGVTNLNGHSVSSSMN